MTITLTGTNSFLQREKLQTLTRAFIKENGSDGLERFEGDAIELQRLIESLKARSLFSPRRMVIVSELSANKPAAENIENVIEAADADDITLIISEPKLDKRGSYYKTLKKSTDFHEYLPLDEGGLTKWLQEVASEGEGSISLAEARYLVQRVGSDQLLLSSEVQKLLNYDPQITRVTVDLLTEQAPQSTVFELLDASFSGDVQRALRLYQDQRQQKVEPQAILAMIAWQLHIVAIVKAAGDRSSDLIAKEAALNPYVVRKTSQVTRRLSMSRVKELIHTTLELDVRLKSQSIDADEALKNYLIDLSTG